MNVQSCLLVLWVAGCASGPAVANDSLRPPASAPPWQQAALAAADVPAVLTAQWSKAGNRDSCAPLAFAAYGVGSGASARAATFSGGWGVAWDRPQLRSAFGIAGAGVSAWEGGSYAWPDTIAWSDGSSAGYGPEGGTGPSQLAYVRVRGQECLYNVWSRLGREHLEYLLSQLRFVQTRAPDGVAPNAAAAEPAPRGVLPLSEGVFQLAIPSAGVTLFGAAHLASEAGRRPTAIFLPGYGGEEPTAGRDRPVIEAEPRLEFLRALRAGGWNTVVIQYRGYWGSGGGYSYEHQLADNQAVLAYLRSPSVARALRIDAGHIAIIGASMGGGGALLTAGADREVPCVAAIAPYNLGRALEEASARPDGIENMVRRRRGGHVRWHDLDDVVREMSAGVERFDLRRHTAALASRPVLLIAGRTDQVVAIADLRELSERLRQDGATVEYVELDDDHNFTRSPIVIGERVLTWLDAQCR